MQADAPGVVKPTALELWREAQGDRDAYRHLLIEHGLLVPRCQSRGEATHRRCIFELDHVGGHNFNPDHFLA